MNDYGCMWLIYGVMMKGKVYVVDLWCNDEKVKCMWLICGVMMKGKVYVADLWCNDEKMGVHVAVMD